MSQERDYVGEVNTANVDAVHIGAMAVPATAFLATLQAEFATGEAEPFEDPSLILQAYELACNQGVLDWKAVTLASGAFIATSVHRGVTARKNAEYQSFMMRTGMELGEDRFVDRLKGRLARGAAIVGAYAVGTRLGLDVNFGGAMAITGVAAGYGMVQARKMGWKPFQQ